jgi:hypothetical protein
VAVAGKVSGIYRRDGDSVAFTNLQLEDSGDQKTYHVPAANTTNKYWDKFQQVTVTVNTGSGYQSSPVPYEIQHPSGYVIFSTALTGTAVAGKNTYTIGTNFVATDTVTFGGITFTAVESGATGNQFNVGVDAAASATNLKNAINSSTLGTTYVATSTSNIITVTEIIAGGGNTPGTMTVVGTGTVTVGTATTSDAEFTPLVQVSGYAFTLVQVAGAFGWSLDLKQDTLDATTFENAGWKEFVVAFRQFTAKVDKFWITNAEMDLFNTELLFAFYVSTQEDKSRFEGWGVISSESVTVSVGELIKAPLEIQGSDVLYYRRG